MRRAIALSLLLPALVGCASHRQPPGVPVDSRPTPPAPPADGVPVVPAPTPVGTVVTADERRATLARIVSDTTSASGAMRKCGSRKLLPDQESVIETTRSLLDQTRAAIRRDELWRAESLARKARQLAASLDCPG
jgi:hypothetical protein